MERRSVLWAALFVLIALILVGVLGYMLITDMTFVDALYMTVITLSTVGFGEPRPLDESGRIFTVFLTVTGLGIFTYADESAEMGERR